MHERERHRIILNTVESRPVATVSDLVEVTGTSEATIRRDITFLASNQMLRKVRGGAEALHPPRNLGLAGRPFFVNEALNIDRKRAIAQEAVAVCDAESIIIHGGTTTYQMVHFLRSHRIQIMTNSFSLAAYLMENSKNTVLMPGGTLYREQNIILSPFENDVTRNFCAEIAFVGCQGIGPMGLMETDSLIIQSEQRLLRQAERIVVLADSSKFDARSSLISCPLEKLDIVITDDGVSEDNRTMLAEAGIRLIIAKKQKGGDA